MNPAEMLAKLLKVDALLDNVAWRLAKKPVGGRARSKLLPKVFHAQMKLAGVIGTLQARAEEKQGGRG